ncbi:hypothetical protein A1O3_06392 [Capronia epimyces CBS 606.96]|uniref:NmrA-like domain-containing protein n=1 Tax=Capronia epimyces CBS 606.96 TaxID=1182542 RepID=W9YJY3_9EURO|nr:uncharacterized protein A1O3_06392 [Capronia epimyces CBS 606.96]EXJ82579.1 hypothetical protein A1O3_06392 [Capronia epimyces CBS 606.96]
MSEVKSVAIAGASGNLGPHVVKAFLDADFQVTVLTRSTKSGTGTGKGTYNSRVKVVPVDFTSVESLAAALKGIDALVSTVAGAAIESQTVLIDAAVAAGVKRFIPSEYGSCTTSPKVAALPLYASMFKIKQYLEEQATAGKLTWTVLACGAFLEFVLGGPMLLDFANHKATLFDKGDNRTTVTSLPTIGKAIVGILKNFNATKNRVVRISEAIVTQNQLLRIAEGLRPNIKWEISEVQTSAVLKEGLDELGAGDFSMPVFMKILKGTALAGDTYGAAFDETDNDLLGVKELTEEDLKKLIAGKLE